MYQNKGFRANHKTITLKMADLSINKRISTIFRPRFYVLNTLTASTACVTLNNNVHHLATTFGVGFIDAMEPTE